MAERIEHRVARERTEGEKAAQPSFTCPECQATSYHPEDVRHKYCGRCHRYTGDPNDPTPGSPRNPHVVPFDYGQHSRTMLDVDTVTGRFTVRPVTDLDRLGLSGDVERGPLDRAQVTASPNALAVMLTCTDCREQTTVVRRPSAVGSGPPLTVAELVRAAEGHVCDPEAAL